MSSTPNPRRGGIGARVKDLSPHATRCLGALAAYIAQSDGKQLYFSRWEIGVVVYGHIQGIQLKTMVNLGRSGLVAPEVVEAVGLVADGVCSCGCDRWTLTDAGRKVLGELNVKVPVLAKRRLPPSLDHLRGMLGGEPEDPADWWKKQS